MNALILAAGRGSRMKGLTEEAPKCYTKLFEKRLIDIQIASLQQANIEKVSAVVGYKSHLIKEDYELHTFENEQWETTNMVSSMLCAQEYFHSSDCIVSYSDIFYPSEAIKKLIRSNGDICILYDKNWNTVWESRFENPLDDAESFKLSPCSNFITNIGKKCTSMDDIEGQYMGLLKFTPKGFNLIQQVLKKSHINPDQLDMTSLLQLLIDNEVRLTAISYDGLWGEIDSENDLKSYQNESYQKLIKNIFN